MKNIQTVSGFLLASLLVVSPLVTMAQGTGVGASVNVSAGASATGTANANASSSDKGSDAGSNNATSSAQGDERRSEVAATVEALLDIADRAGGIGAEVRAVAMEQQSANSEAEEAKEKTENRNALVTFLIGTDYKSIGVLRSTLTTTQNSVDRLERALAATADASVEADLEAQIDVLEEEHADVSAFIEAEVSKFSLFGWLALLLAGDDA